MARTISKSYLNEFLGRRWVHFVGDSLTGYFRQSIEALLLYSGYQIYGNTRITQNLPWCRSLNHAGWWFIPELQLLITEESDDNGRNLTAFDVDKHFSCVQEMTRYDGLPPMDNFVNIGPDIIMFNHGLHSAYRLDSLIDLDLVREYETNAFRALGKYSRKGTLLIWRNTAPTHFSIQRKLPGAWSCRTVPRVACINELSREALKQAAKAGQHMWKELDFWRLGQLRPDCAPDNRHYSEGNCAAYLLTEFLARLPGWFISVKNARKTYSDLRTEQLLEFGQRMNSSEIFTKAKFSMKNNNDKVIIEKYYESFRMLGFG